MIHDFIERLNFSEGIELEEELIQHLLDSIPASTGLVRATPTEDRSGIDYWITRAHGLRPIGIDVKHREFDPIERFNSDDACIETTSVYDGLPWPPWEDKYRRKLGWTIDSNKHTDLIIYTWPATQGRRRFWVLYFPHLCRAAQANWRIWAAHYGELPAYNNGYITLSVYPPRYVIAEAMRKYTVGII